MKLARLIDLEAQLARDRATEEEDPAAWEAVLERDRRIAASLGDTGPPRVFLDWLEAARGDEPLPGDRLVATGIALRRVLVVLALLAGAGLILGLKQAARHGAHLNVTLFWFGSVGVQLLLLFLLLLAGVLGACGWDGPARWLAAAQRGVAGLGRRGMARALRRHGSAQAGRLQAGLGRLSGKRPYYGRIGRWLAMECTQRCAVAFNLAALAALFLLGEVQQLPFRWSTTRGDSAWFPAAVRGLSAPWASWLPAAAPGPEVIRVTRSPATGPPPAPAQVAAWWYFLLMNLAVYGLALRAGAWGFSAWRLRRALRDPPLDHEDFRRLHNRLTRTWFVEPAAAGAAPGVRRVFWGALPVGLEDAVAGRMRGVHGGEDWRRAGHRADPDEDAALCRDLGRGDPRRVVLMIPVWNEPVEELADFIVQLREAVGPAAEIVVDLVDGNPAAGLEAVDTRRKMVWEHFLGTVRDPRLTALAGGGSE